MNGMEKSRANLRPGANGLQGAKGMRQRLNPMQKKFCREYVKSGIGKDAASIAGYKEPNNGAIRLLKKPAILAYIDSLEAKAESATILTKTKVLERLSHEAMNCKSGSVRVRALELLGKHYGMFIERVEHGGVGEFDNMSDDELRADILKWMKADEGETVN